MGDLAETSAVRVDGIERFIAARCGWVEFALLEQKAASAGQRAPPGGLARQTTEQKPFGPVPVRPSR